MKVEKLCIFNNENQNFGKLMCSFGAGTLVNSVIYPLEILRVRTFYKKKIIGSALSTTNGLFYSIALGSIKAGATYGGQQILKDKLMDIGVDKKDSQIISGFGIGLLNGILFNPFYAIKTRVQAVKKRHSVISHAKMISSNHGINGFFRGAGSMIIRDSVWGMVYFSHYDFVLGRLRNVDEKFKQQNKIIASTASATVSALCAYPLDGMRLYRQHHKHDYDLMHGLKLSFQMDSHNIKSVSFGLTRTILSIILTHMGTLFLQDLFLEQS